ncbi:MAG: molybdopterin dinucleotide-binding protein [Candidatus Bathyarchaeota archaeon]|jgi:formylmethanofuran dehydrogenase subunit D|nr:molybdopterin dinucleotide-binding protein [Candidatus Bathyarchaeota archaeon]
MVQEKLNLILLTGRTIDQGVGKESGKSTKLYFDSTTMCYMDETDMNKLGLRNNDHIMATTEEGSVVLRAIKHPRGAMPGMIYIPYGPWANAICSSKTTSIGMPSFKGTPVEVKPAPNQPVLTLEELLKKEFGR